MIRYEGPVYGGRTVPLQGDGPPRLGQAIALVDRFLSSGELHQGLAVQDRHTLRHSLAGRHLAVRLVTGGFPAPGPSFAALTWDRTIHFRPVPEAVGESDAQELPQNSLFFHIRTGATRSAEGMAALLVHELVHIEQQHLAFLGLPGFLVAYLIGWAKVGFRYGPNPYETAARAREQEARISFATPAAESP
jgi:hypothetical protein